MAKPFRAAHIFISLLEFSLNLPDWHANDKFAILVNYFLFPCKLSHFIALLESENVLLGLKDC